MSRQCCNFTCNQGRDCPNRALAAHQNRAAALALAMLMMRLGQKMRTKAKREAA